jgi:hypothetical protein
MCSNLGWLLNVNVNDEPVLVEGAIADWLPQINYSVAGVQVQPQLGVYVELLVNGQDNNEKKKKGSGSSASAGGVPPWGGGGGSVDEWIQKIMRDVKSKISKRNNRLGELVENLVGRKLRELGQEVEPQVRVETPFEDRVFDWADKKRKIGYEVKANDSPYPPREFFKDYYLREYKDWRTIVIRVYTKKKMK